MSLVDYGILSTLSYHSLQKKWCSANCARRVTATGGCDHTYDSIESLVLLNPRPSDSNHKNRASSLEGLSKSLSQAHSIPGFAPCASIVSEFLHESDIITKANSLHDTLTGNLVAKGSAKEVDSKNYETPSKLIPVIAFASGTNGSDLSIMDASQIYAHDKIGASVLQGYNTPDPVFKFRLAIYQICFAELFSNRSTSPFFAVRTASGTSLFILTYKRWAPHKNSRGFNALHIGDIGNNMTAGPQHAHVAFNPWLARQLVIIDVEGNWSTWNIGGRYSEIKSSYSICPHNSGAIRAPLAIWQELKTVKIIWGKDINTLIVCCGRQIAEINISKSSSTVKFVGDILGADEGDILDIKRCANIPSAIFVISLFHVFWLNITNLNVEQTWKHSRHVQDMTLKLAIQISNNRTRFYIYSRYNRVVSIFGRTVKGSSSSVVTRNPEVFSLPFGHLMTIDSCSIQSSLDLNSSKELSLILTSARRGLGVSFDIFFPGFAKTQERKTKKRQKSIKYFHPCQSEEKYQLEDVRSLRQVSTNTYTLEDTRLRINGPPPMTCPPQFLGRISDVIHDYKSKSTDRTTPSNGQTTKEEYFEHVKRLLITYHRGYITSRTLLEIYPPIGLFEELISASRDLENLSARNLISVTDKYPLWLFACTSLKGYVFGQASFSDSPENLSALEKNVCEDRDIAEVAYKQAMTIWLGNMPSSVPGQIRLKKEHLSRRISQDVALASLNVCAQHNESNLSESSERLCNRDDPYSEDANRTSYNVNLRIGASIGSKMSHTASPTAIRTHTPKCLWEFTSARNHSLVTHDIGNLIDDWPVVEQDPRAYTWKPLREKQLRNSEAKREKRANDGPRGKSEGLKKAQGGSSGTSNKRNIHDRKGRHVTVGKESTSTGSHNIDKTRSSGRKGSGIERTRRREGF